MRIPFLFAMSLVLALLAGGRAAAQHEAEGPSFRNWAVGILAADWRDSEGLPILAFENARRDLAKEFALAGFDPAHITSLSLRPRILGGQSLKSEDAFSSFQAQARTASDGCLFYFTSHGYTHGITLGNEGSLSPAELDRLLNRWCGTRPTVVIVSACYSGVFVPALSKPHRLVITAARADRSSFGCGAEFRYPYFDGCVLQSLPQAENFVELAFLTRDCVLSSEAEMQLTPPSEPQAVLGGEVSDLLMSLTFTPRLTDHREDQVTPMADAMIGKTAE